MLIPPQMPHTLDSQKRHSRFCQEFLVLHSSLVRPDYFLFLRSTEHGADQRPFVGYVPGIIWPPRMSDSSYFQLLRFTYLDSFIFHILFDIFFFVDPSSKTPFSCNEHLKLNLILRPPSTNWHSQNSPIPTRCRLK